MLQPKHESVWNRTDLKTLDQIGQKFGTDKSTASHCYLPLYELIFARMSEWPEQRILEIGVQFGNSLKTWQDYFAYPFIVGIDSVNNGVEIDGVTVLIGDAYDTRMVVQASTFGEFNLIIEDGSHAPEHQAFVVRHYSELLAPKGILIIEDVPTKEAIQLLKQALPMGFQYTAISMVGGNADSRLFICWK